MMPFNVWYADPQAANHARHGRPTERRGHRLGLAVCSAHIGYWVDERVAARGIIPTALALAVDHCFRTVGLHRVEVNIRPENARPPVAEKLGFREEGLRRAYLHIDGGWRDHIAYALTAPEVPEGMVNRWQPRAVQSLRMS